MNQVSSKENSSPLNGGARLNGVPKISKPGEPLISIVTVSFNSAMTLDATIKSVLSQEYKNIEYIVIDGGSTDDTLKIIHRYEGSIDYWVSEKDEGIYQAMNKGISIAKGDYVGMLNSDDIFSTSRSVSLIVETFRKYNSDAVHGNIEIVDRNNVDRVKRYYSSKKFSKGLIRYGIFPAHPTFYCRRSLYEQVGYYKMNYRVSADSEMMVRLLIGHDIALKYIDETLVKMREGGISNNDLWGKVHQNFEIVRACRENGLYTNILLLVIKIPFKLMQFFRR